MARPRSPQPAYQYHVSGQAKVRLGHDDFYLGKHGTPESYARYYALLAEYNANGKVAPVKERKPPIHQAHLTETAAAMVKLQLATAMRPSEIFRMRPCDIDRRGENWIYRPESHKTEHHGKAKAVPILGDAFKALAPFMFGEPNELCFRTTKGTPWNKDSYRIAVTRAAKAAKVEHWTPYQIRHTAAQAVRDAVGPEGAQALLGHSRLSTTEVYAKASEAKAIEAAWAAPTL